MKNSNWKVFQNIIAPVILSVFILTVSLTFFPEVVFSGNGGGVTVFVLDTGIDDIFVEEGVTIIDPVVSHGSIVSRIIKEEAPEIQLFSHSVEGEGGQLREDYYLAGLRRIIDYQRDHPRERVLVNISLAFSGYLTEHHRMIKELYQAGVMVIAAAGNEGTEKVVYPAGFGEVVAVADASIDGRTPSSNYGLHIDLSAPGSVEYITRVYFSEGIGFSRLINRGTSFSAPRVTGLLARLLLDHPELTPWEGLKIIEMNSDSVADPLFKEGLLGAGVISRERALEGQPPFYRSDRFWPAILLLLAAVPAALFCWKKYGMLSLFLLLLVLLVVVPLALLLFGQAAGFFQAAGFGLLEAITLGGSAGAAFILTGWSPVVILGSYALLIFSTLTVLLFPDQLSLLSRQDFLLFCLLPVTLVFLVEKGLLLLLYSLKGREGRVGILIFFLGSRSSRIDLLVRKALVLRAEEGKAEREELQMRLKADLLKSNSHRKRTALIRVLAGLAEPPVEFLLSIAVKNNSYRDFIRDSLREQGQNILPGLFQLLRKGKVGERWLVGNLLSRVGRDLSLSGREGLINLMVRALADRNFDREIILLSLADFKQEAGQAVPLVAQLLQEKGDNWLRFQALKTLAAIHPAPEELLPLLEEMSIDSPEPVRSEVRGLLDELNKDSPDLINN